jgi:hypothetical protein
MVLMSTSVGLHHASCTALGKHNDTTTYTGSLKVPRDRTCAACHTAPVPLPLSVRAHSSLASRRLVNPGVSLSFESPWTPAPRTSSGLGTQRAY